MFCKIYCIECNITGEKYIGSTNEKNLSRRIAYHIYKKSCSCKYIIERGNWKYYLLEEVDESQKLIREQYWIDNTYNCINHRRAFTDKKEYMKEYMKEYNQLNKDKIKEYNELNKDKIKEYHKFKNSWGGDKRYHNNLLLIDVSLFN